MNRLRRILVNVSTLVALLVAPSVARAQQIDHAQAATPLRQLPIRFEPTTQKGVLVARGIGAAIRLSSTSIEFPLRRNGDLHDSIRIRFDGARRSSRAIGVDPLPARVNYLYGDRARWRSNVPTYARARTSNLYRGIDVDYYGAGDQLEYDLIVQSGANLDRIRLSISGATVEISEAGDLVYAPDARVLLRKPTAYQVIANERRTVAVDYRRHADGTFGFTVGGYDRRQPLVIDPVVAYSFSFGGSGDEQVYDIAATKRARCMSEEKPTRLISRR